jgi:hypothetical protein
MRTPLVLIVEDNAVVRKIAQLNLQRYGVDSHVATNGLEAIEMFAQHVYDLILMDVAMPGMNGLRATELIREAEKDGRGRVPIVALTAGGSKEECIQAGMDDYVRKPPDYLRVLRKWLPQWFDRRSA